MSGQTKNNVNTITNTAKTAQSAAQEERNKAKNERDITRSMLGNSSGSSLAKKQSWWKRLWGNSDDTGADVATRFSESNNNKN